MAKTKSNVLVGVAALYYKWPIGDSYIEVGYTEDGVQMEYSADLADVEVEEETFPIQRVITKETLTIQANMAESSLINIDKAIAGSKLVGNFLTIGDGINKEMSVKLVGKNPAGYDRTIEIPLATASGNVGMSYRKGAKTVVPVTFAALKPCSGAAFTVTDATS
jgi:hypothetical protein